MPGTGPESASLDVRCDLSWAARGNSVTLSPDATGRVFTIDATVPLASVPGLRVGTCTVSDDQSREATVGYMFTIGEVAANAPPSVSAGGPYSVAEGGTVSLAASGSDPEVGTLAYAWDLDNDGTYETTGMTPSFSAAALDGPASYTVGVQVTDDGGLTAGWAATHRGTKVAPSTAFESPAGASVAPAFASAPVMAGGLSAVGCPAGVPTSIATCHT